MIPAGVRTWREHTMRNDGTPVESMTFEQPHAIEKAAKAASTD